MGDRRCDSVTTRAAAGSSPRRVKPWPTPFGARTYPPHCGVARRHGMNSMDRFPLGFRYSIG